MNLYYRFILCFRLICFIIVQYSNENIIYGPKVGRPIRRALLKHESPLLQAHFPSAEPCSEPDRFDHSFRPPPSHCLHHRRRLMATALWRVTSTLLDICLTKCARRTSPHGIPLSASSPTLMRWRKTLVLDLLVSKFTPFECVSSTMSTYWLTSASGRGDEGDGRVSFVHFLCKATRGRPIVESSYAM